jgi:hypothetical protein
VVPRICSIQAIMGYTVIVAVMAAIHPGDLIPLLLASAVVWGAVWHSYKSRHSEGGLPPAPLPPHSAC